MKQKEDTVECSLFMTEEKLPSSSFAEIQRFHQVIKSWLFCFVLFFFKLMSGFVIAFLSFGSEM